jgi:hypothetical protein
LLLVPGPTLPLLEGFAMEPPGPTRLLRAVEPVVIPLRILVMSLCAGGPTLPLLEAPGAGWFCANAPPVDNATMHAETKSILFILGLLWLTDANST